MKKQPTEAVLVHQNVPTDLGLYTAPYTFVRSEVAAIVADSESPLGGALLYCPWCQLSFRMRLRSDDEIAALTQRRMQAIGWLLALGIPGSIWGVSLFKEHVYWLAVVVAGVGFLSLFSGIVLFLVKTHSYTLTPHPATHQRRLYNAVHVVELQ